MEAQRVVGTQSLLVVSLLGVALKGYFDNDLIFGMRPYFAK